MILVTGGAGYIGAHTLVALHQSGYRTVVFDNLDNGSRTAVERAGQITGQEAAFFQGDLRRPGDIEGCLARYPGIRAVVHLAGLKAVADSVKDPLAYYENNVGGTLRLLSAMEDAGIRRMVFSSSATVYGDPARVPVSEEAPLSPVNPYGRTKRIVEEILEDWTRAGSGASAVVLRYFNPIGAHQSGTIGEDPRGVPANLLPVLARVAAGTLEALPVYGCDYDTPDGTGVRDYLHVMDLAEGHVKALEAAEERGRYRIYNLGTGRGYSVCEVARAFGEACGRPIPLRTEARRPGDVAACWADPGRAREELGWTAHRDLTAMCQDAWRWQSRNPEGYGEEDQTEGK